MAAMGKDKRLHPRAIVRLKARLRESGEEEWREVLLFDLSAGGAAVHTSHEVPIQSEVRLEFELPEEVEGQSASVGVTCLVVRSTSVGRGRRGPAFVAGLHFLDLQARDFDRVRVYIWNLMEPEHAP